MSRTTTKTFFSGALALLFGFAANIALAAEGDNFVDEASAKGIAEIETAKMALDKGTSEDVKQFAQKMIDDHTQANQKLAQLAQQKNLEMSDEATLMDKAKAMILQLRDGENFDEAYANNQVVAHEQTIELYRDYVEGGDNPDLKQFAQQTLPKLEEHLKQAKELQAKHGQKNGGPGPMPQAGIGSYPVRQLPVDRLKTLLSQKLIGTTEVAVTQKTTMRRQWRRVRRLEHQMPRRIDQSRLRLCVRAPEHEHQMRATLANHLDHSVGELLPASLGMGSCQALLHRQRGV